MDYEKQTAANCHRSRKSKTTDGMPSQSSETGEPYGGSVSSLPRESKEPLPESSRPRRDGPGGE